MVISIVTRPRAIPIGTDMTPNIISMSTDPECGVYLAGIFIVMTMKRSNIPTSTVRTFTTDIIERDLANFFSSGGPDNL